MIYIITSGTFHKFAEFKYIDLILAPAMGGVIIGYEIGKLLKKELNLNIGTLKRVKNLSSNEDELMNMLGQIKG